MRRMGQDKRITFFQRGRFGGSYQKKPFCYHPGAAQSKLSRIKPVMLKEAKNSRKNLE